MTSKNLEEAIKLFIPDSNTIHSIVNGASDEMVPLPEGGEVPTVRKAFADSLLFKNPTTWNSGSTETDPLQLRTFTDGLIYWAPTAQLTNPIAMGTSPVGDSNWKISPINNKASAIEGVSQMREDIIGGVIYPSEPEKIAKVGDVVPVGTTHLKLADGIYEIGYVEGGILSSIAERDCTIGGEKYNTVKVNTNVVSYGAGIHKDLTEPLEATWRGTRHKAFIPDLGVAWQMSGAKLGGTFKGLGGATHLGTRITTSEPIEVGGAFLNFSNFRLYNSNKEKYAFIFTRDPDNNAARFGHHLTDMRVISNYGLNIDSVETKIDNYYGRGDGPLQGMGYATDSIGINITNWDTSIRTAILEEHHVGVRTVRGVQAYDLHVVRAMDAVQVRQNGQPSQFVNTYIDTPRRHGFRLVDQNYTSCVNTQFLKVGTPETSSESTCFSFENGSSNNQIVNFTVNQSNLSTLSNIFRFTSANSKNNVIANGGGSYKMSSATFTERLRNQTVYGCTGGLARHNNITRKNRAGVPSVAQGESVDLIFTLDWSYPDPSDNFFLFKGSFTARNSNAKAAYGDLHVVVGAGVLGVNSSLTKISGSTGCNWQINSATLNGDILTVNITNTGDDTSRFSAELERSVDPRLLTV